MTDVIFTPIRLAELESLIEKSMVRAIQSQRQSLPEEPKKYISIATACAILSITPPTIYEYLKAGKLKKYKIGSTTRLLKAEVLSIVMPE